MASAKLPSEEWQQPNSAPYDLRQLLPDQGIPAVLPTKAEWKFAARGGTQSKNLRYAGSDRLNSVADFNNLQEYTFLVGTRCPNELGLFDMSGTVREWCSDLYLVYPNCKGKNKNEYFVRGGSWASRKDALAVWARDHEQAHRRNSALGFRIMQEWFWGFCRLFYSSDGFPPSDH